MPLLLFQTCQKKFFHFYFEILTPQEYIQFIQKQCSQNLLQAASSVFSQEFYFVFSFLLLLVTILLLLKFN